MKPLIVLISATLIALLIAKILGGDYSLPRSTRFGMSAMLIFTALGHFMFSEGMAMMIPEFIPFKMELVYFTAIIEIGAAIGLHIPQFRILTAWLLIIFLILIIPANIKAAIEEIDYQKATFDGKGLSYLWFRIPLQMLFIAWVYFSSIKFH